ncbi:hypothetical protein UT300005_00750 [Clostridium sp. CTA-5]
MYRIPKKMITVSSHAIKLNTKRKDNFYEEKKFTNSNFNIINDIYYARRMWTNIKTYDCKQ